MTESKYDMMQKVSQEALLDPRPGDYWSDHFCPIMLVLKVEGELVTVCSKRIAVGNDHWSFDINHQVVMTKSELREKLSYESKDLQKIPWGECSRHRKGSKMFEFVLEAEKLTDSNKIVTRYVPSDKLVNYDRKALTIPGTLSERIDALINYQGELLVDVQKDKRVELTLLLKSFKDYLSDRQKHPRYLDVAAETVAEPKEATDFKAGVYACYNEILKANQMLTEGTDLQKAVLLCLSAGYVAASKLAEGN